MPNEVDMVMFAIQAVIRLGKKIQAVFEDEVRDRELILPPVEGSDLPFWGTTEVFFAGEGKAFVASPERPVSEKREPCQGVYYEWWKKRDEGNVYRDKLREAHRRILEGLEKYRAADDVQGAYRRPGQFYAGSNALLVVKQWREGTDPKRPPVQRIAGTVVEIALDYVKADPTLFSGNGREDRITRAFLLSLDDVNFAEAEFDDLLIDVLRASLETFRVHADLVLAEDHMTLLLREVSTTLSEAIREVQMCGDDDKLRAIYAFRREMLEQVVTVSAQIVSEHPERFIGTPKTQEEKLLASVLKAVLKTVQKESGLFTHRTLVDIYAAGLRAVAQNRTLILPDTQESQSEIFLENLFAGIANQLPASAERDPPGIFSSDVLREVIEAALDVVAENTFQLIDPKNPEKQLLVDALERVILAVSNDFHQNADLSGILEGLFSRRQLVEIVEEVFEAVARRPEGLLQGIDNDPKRSALAQIIGAVAATIGKDTRHLLNGDDYVSLFAVALRVFAVNPDRLLDLDTADPLQNVMTQVMTSVVTTATRHLEAGGRHLLDGEMLVQMIESGLGVVSKNVNGFLENPEMLSIVMDRLLKATSSGMANELDAENLLWVFAPIFMKALQEREALDVTDAELILPVLTAMA